MKFISALTCTLIGFISAASGAELYTQPHDGSGTLHQSSWFAPDDSDYDQHVWDNFMLASSQAITEIRWRGGFIYNGQYSPTVADFTVAIWATSIAGEPDITNAPLVQYQTGDNAGQIPAGVFGGIAMYDYHFALPASFQATAGVKYWVFILAAQYGIPEWGFAKGTGGNGSHFRWLRGAHMYQNVPGDVVFTLIGSEAPTHTITAISSPVQAGTIQGAGQYPVGAGATLVAIPNPSWGFWRWTENGQTVSNSMSYNFVVTGDRTLVADFVPAYTVTTTSSPTYGGSTTGGGIFNSETSVTVEAMANPGFVFDSWTEFGTTVSSSAMYTFTSTANRPLVANFAHAPGSMTFDFDNAPVHTSLPIDLLQNGLNAHLSDSGNGFSIQPVGTVGISPPGFSGLCVWPNTVFGDDLTVDFSQPLTFFSVLYSPQELGCDDSATMRVTAFLNGVLVGTATATVPVPGTYPSGTLLISAPTGFNRAVVHYDSPPPTCQDWGPAFMVDNMTVTVAGLACQADIVANGVVNVDDLLAVINAWGTCANPSDCPADIAPPGPPIGNDVVNVDDLLAVINAWGACP